MNSTELHNYIYGHATESERRKLSYLGLTQVCRQVRNEFRPVYMNNTCDDMYGNEIAAYLDVFHSEWPKHDVSEDKASTFMAITRRPRSPPTVEERRASRIFLRPYEEIKLLPKFLPGQGAEIVELCRERAKIATRSWPHVSARIYCEMTDIQTTYYIYSNPDPGMALRQVRVFRARSVLLEAQCTGEISAILEPERGACEERSIWSGFQMSID